MKKRFRETFLVILAVTVFDQLTKNIILKILSLNESIPIIKGVFHLTLVENTGIAFGLFKGRSIFFVVTSLAVIFILILNLSYRNFNDKKTLSIPLALILGGAVGNLIDRLRFGYIVDFLDFRIWPVFNLADSAITIGGILLAFILLKKPDTI